jgi:UDP-glucose:(heptosyl)LPS alpha-1,3-glucosyltransferase
MPTIRVAVVSPFIDKWHGTERLIAEWVSRLPREYEIHIYSQHVEDLDLNRMRWHRIPRIPGPHLFNFLWWFAANHAWRWWDGRFRGLRYDIVYTAGTNCLNADLISVHVVFARFLRQVQPELKLLGSHLRFWPRLIHRRLYYKLIIFLERHIYSNRNTGLILIAHKTAVDLKHFYGRDDAMPILYVGLDHHIFNPESRLRSRDSVREQLGLADNDFVLLLIGNDWKSKGLASLLESLSRLRDLPLVLLVAGKDDAIPYQARIQEMGLQERVRLLPARADVQWYYAAADVYTGPSLEDTFALPPFEAMACGLPVITTVTNGTAEIMTDGVDGLIIEDPNDVTGLTERIRRLYQEPELRQRLAEQAQLTARKYTWEGNGEQIRAIFAEALRRKGHSGIRPIEKSRE